MAGKLDVPQFETAPHSHPWTIRTLNRVGRLLPSGRSLTSRAVWDAARKGSLRDCEPTKAAAEVLEVLLESLAASMNLNFVGRLSAKEDTIRIARTHLRVHRALRETPAVRDTPLPRPSSSWDGPAPARPSCIS